MYHLFCGFKNAQKPPHVCVLHKRCPSKCCKICRKVRVLESIFNKVKLATLLKKTLTQVFSCGFFEIIKGDFFIKHLRVSASECWRLEKSSWLLISSPVRFLILNDSILRTFSCDVKTLSSSFLLKSERFHQSSQKFLLCYQCFSCLIIVGKVVNLLLTFVICMIFFPCSFHVILALVEVMVSMGVFIVFWLTCFLCSFSLLSIDLRIAVVIHGFLSACGNPRF